MYSSYYKDMLISKIDSLGNLKWMKKLPKRQTGGSYLGGMSYAYLNNNLNHYLIFMDNVKNIGLSVDKTPHRHDDGKGGYLTAYKINNETVDVLKSSILNTEKLEGNNMSLYEFTKQRVIQISEDEFIVEFHKKKKQDVLIKVKIKEEEKIEAKL